MPSVGIIIFALLLLLLNFNFSCAKRAFKGWEWRRMGLSKIMDIPESCQGMWETPKTVTCIPTAAEMEVFTVVIITTTVSIAIFGVPWQTHSFLRGFSGFSFMSVQLYLGKSRALSPLLLSKLNLQPFATWKPPAWLSYPTQLWNRSLGFQSSKPQILHLLIHLSLPLFLSYSQSPCLSHLLKFF